MRKIGQKPSKAVAYLLSDAAWLEKRYIDERKSTREIGEELGVSSTAVLKRLKKAGISTRHRCAPVVECASCRKMFKTHPSVIKVGHGIYCSTKCHNEARRKTVLCETCGKELSLPGSSKQRFCSRQCDYAARPGENSSNWKGGVSKDRNAYYRRRYAANPEAAKAQRKEWLEANPEKAKEISDRQEAKRRGQNPARCRKYRQENPGKVDAYNHSVEQADSRRKYRNKRYLSDEEFRICTLISNALRSALNGSRKHGRTWEIIGCTKEFFMEWIQSQFKRGMSWNNHGAIWHIDHKVGIAKFNHTDPEEVKRCWNYSNLRPLWARENIQNKHNKGPVQPGLGI